MVESHGFTGRNSTVLLSILCIIRRHAQGELQRASIEHRRAGNGIGCLPYTVNAGPVEAVKRRVQTIYNSNKTIRTLIKLMEMVQIGAQHA